MDDGLISESTMGVPQGGPLSPILSNVYLDKLDKELENRGLRFARYADDCNIFVKSERAADRSIKSITQWIEKELRLKVNLTKSKVVRPTKVSVGYDGGCTPNRLICYNFFKLNSIQASFLK
ncbi:reverse transcriptase domain-containing protein [Enterococcus cecorum]|uniref:reverse transcriptase domain-containing protein n=1 Tax=Enterococcus cecorum TaxID=44008 RepID=UPI0025A3992A|nr:reverse transcriptase domain-containing protein [Enterococcus cecorum]MDM8183432.1 reverse transcriptase domain-containing protein [Enterococcus cecorum]